MKATYSACFLHSIDQTYNKNIRVYTVGHSTRELEEFIRLLKHYKITQLIYVRTMPMSRHTPQFNHDTLDKALVKYYITYRNLKILGGLRPAKKDTVNYE